jgi:hypothetical protein
MPGCAASAASTSSGAIFSPPEMSTSSARPCTCAAPPASTKPRSRVWKRPPGATGPSTAREPATSRTRAKGSGGALAPARSPGRRVATCETVSVMPQVSATGAPSARQRSRSAGLAASPPRRMALSDPGKGHAGRASQHALQHRRDEGDQGRLPGVEGVGDARGVEARQGEDGDAQDVPLAAAPRRPRRGGAGGTGATGPEGRRRPPPCRAIDPRVPSLPTRARWYRGRSALPCRRHASGTKEDALGFQIPSHEIETHPLRDSGCLDADELLESQARRYAFAMVVANAERSGREDQGREKIEESIERKLASSGWGSRARAVLVEPGIDRWLLEHYFQEHWSPGARAQSHAS